MTDLSIVIEKLQSFDCVDDLADYFRGYGIKAQPRNARSCPIAVYVSMETGQYGVVVNTTGVGIENEEGEQLASFYHSDAMSDFVDMYDRGCYPDLIEEGYEVNTMYNCCPDCG